MLDRSLTRKAPLRRGSLLRLWLFGTLALLGLAAFVPYAVVLAAKHLWDAELIEGDAGWYVIAAGFYGGMAFLVFGAIAFAAWREAGRDRAAKSHDEPPPASTSDRDVGSLAGPGA